MLDWINENKEWMFSGGGIVFFGWIGKSFLNNRKKESNDGQKIISGNNSKNYQSERDINIVERRDIDEQ